MVSHCWKTGVAAKCLEMPDDARRCLLAAVCANGLHLALSEKRTRERTGTHGMLNGTFAPGVLASTRNDTQLEC